MDMRKRFQMEKSAPEAYKKGSQPNIPQERVGNVTFTGNVLSG